MFQVVIEALQFAVSEPMEKAEAVRIAALLSQYGEKHGIKKV